MELRAFANRILLGDTLEWKLERVCEPFTDMSPGQALRIVEPNRPPDLIFAPRRASPAMPHPSTFQQPRKSGRLPITFWRTMNYRRWK